MQLPAFYRYCSESNRNSVISPITSSQSQNTGADPICNARRSLRRGADKTVLDHPRLRSVSLSRRSAVRSLTTLMMLYTQSTKEAVG